MNVDDPIVILRLLYLYENFINNFESQGKHAKQALEFTLRQIKAKSIEVKRAAVNAFTVLITLSKLYVPISTFMELTAIARDQAADLLKTDSLTSFLEAIIALLPSWEDQEEKVQFFN